MRLTVFIMFLGLLLTSCKGGTDFCTKYCAKRIPQASKAHNDSFCSYVTRGATHCLCNVEIPIHMVDNEEMP